MICFCKKWFTAAELAAMKLPGLPETEEEIEVFMLRRVLAAGGFFPVEKADLRADLAAAEAKIRKN